MPSLEVAMSDKTVTTKTFSADDIKFATEEALKRYPQASSGIAFLIGALGFQSMDVTEEDRQWALETIMSRNPP